MPGSRRSSQWLFFVLAYGWSWLFWMPAGLSGLEFGDSPIPVLIALGGIGPLVASVALTYLTQGRQGRRDYWRRVVDFKRISVGWYAIILLIVPVLTAVAVLLDVLSGGRGAHLQARFQANAGTHKPRASAGSRDTVTR